MDAFSILLGERASSEFIRHGKDSFVIDGIFDIADHQSLLVFITIKKYIGRGQSTKFYLGPLIHLVNLSYWQMINPFL